MPAQMKGVMPRQAKTAGFFEVNDLVLYGKYKNKRGKIVRMFLDSKGHPTVEIEPIPKGRKQNKTMGMFKFWHAPDPVEEKKAMSIASRVAARVQMVAAEAEASGMTADDMVAKLQRELHRFSHMLLNVDKGLKLGGDDSVFVTFSRVPKSAGELDAINSPIQFMLSIRGPRWGQDQPAPAKVKVEQFRGRGIKFRAVTATPEKAIDAIVKFFKSNEDTLLSLAPPEKKAMTSPLIKRILDKVQGTTREARLVKRVIAKAKEAGLGETTERGMVRVHRFRGMFKVWDLTNAGKRGKTVKVMTVSPNIKGDEEAWMDRMESQMEMGGYESYGEVHALFADLLQDFPGEIRINEQTERGVDVIPANVRTLKLEWKVKTKSDPGDAEFRLQATPLDFHLVSSYPFAGGPDKKEVFRQDTIYSPVSKADAKVFYSWAAVNEAELKKMDLDALRKLWGELKIRVDYH